MITLLNSKGLQLGSKILNNNTKVMKRPSTLKLLINHLSNPRTRKLPKSHLTRLTTPSNQIWVRSSMCGSSGAYPRPCCRGIAPHALSLSLHDSLLSVNAIAKITTNSGIHNHSASLICGRRCSSIVWHLIKICSFPSWPSQLLWLQNFWPLPSWRCAAAPPCDTVHLSATFVRMSPPIFDPSPEFSILIIIPFFPDF